MVFAWHGVELGRSTKFVSVGSDVLAAEAIVLV